MTSTARWATCSASSCVPTTVRAGAKLLRNRWETHVDTALLRPVLLIDEAQESAPSVLNELRLLCQVQLDSHLLLTVILAGDRRLLQRLEADELLPLDSRIRVRLSLARASSEELLACLRHALSKAGTATLMTPELCATLCDHAAGNYRALFNMAGELLAGAAHRDRDRLDEKLFLETFVAPPSDASGAGRWR